MVVVLQPRRVAAKSAASRMASILGEAVGETVGYRVRHDVAVSSKSKVVVVTEGVLVQWLRRDPTLDGIACVLLDEFHERTLDMDLCLALCRDMQLHKGREDVRLLVMSATFGDTLAKSTSQLLGDCPVIASEGRHFPVDVRYLNDMELMSRMGKPSFDHELPRVVASALVRVLAVERQGDVLVFLPGEPEIRCVAPFNFRAVDRKVCCIHPAGKLKSGGAAAPG